MPALNLMAKLALDISGFQQSMAKVRTAAAPAAQKFGEQFRGKLLEAFGVGGMIGVMRNSLRGASDIMKGASKAGVDSETFQTLQRIADHTGVSIEDMAKEMQDGSAYGRDLAGAVSAMNAELLDSGQIIRNDTVAALNEFNDKLTQLTGRLSPGLAAVTSVLIAVYDWIAKIVRIATYTAGWIGGNVIGDKAHARAANELLHSELVGGAWKKANPDGSDPGQSAEDRAYAIAAGLDRMKGGSGARGSQRVEASSLTQVGGYMNPQFGFTDTGPGRELQRLNAQVAEIRHNTRRFSE